MVRTLNFNLADVQKVLDHAMDHDQEEVYLVKDEGVYLMSRGEAYSLIYATYQNITCDPKSPRYDWDMGQDICGGDDTALDFNTLELAGNLEEAQRDGFRTFSVKVHHNGMYVTRTDATVSKKAPPKAQNPEPYVN